MNNWARLITLCSFLLIISNNAMARGNTAYEETYNVGLLAGQISGDAEHGDADATGFILSARNQKAILEYVSAKADGGVLASGGSWESNISGLYLSLLGTGQPYMKFKVGKIKQEMIKDDGIAVTTNTNDITSYGIGLGYKMGSRIKLEFEVTTLDNDMTLMAVSVLF